MNPNKLRSRTKFIEGRPLKNRAQVKTMSRRDPGKISPETIRDPEDKFETFFDYEEELSGLKSSSEQFHKMQEEVHSMEMEELLGDENENEYQNDKLKEEDEYLHGSIMMEDVSPIVLGDIEEEIANNSSNNKGSFVFIQCEFTKKDGNRCRRQAPKNGTLCSAHRKLSK